MKPKLYMNQLGSPDRAVLMTAQAIGIDLELKEISLLNKDHLSRKFRKLNPQHSIPLLIDTDGFIIWDSHAIMAYLVSKYAKDDSLYSKDLRKRAIIDQRLHFDSSIIYSTASRIFATIIFKHNRHITDEDKQAILDAYEITERFLAGNKWIAGNSVTIADYSLIASITTTNIIAPIDSEKFPHLTNWLKRAAALREYEVNRVGLYKLQQYLKCLLSPI